ncbi:hypothetical protein OHA21_29145 [Actinoplanes sp. NBC_00393]|uniref:hypothetical protein n=1 Tax=Actinoplanes sp. NBC_00393 TaxID=2975953 RepID=UPI002E1C074F
MKLRAAAVIVVMVGLVTVGCTGPDEPSNVPGGDVQPSMTFEEAYRELPMDGTKDLPITWDLSQVSDSDEVFAARRSLVFRYWLGSATDRTTVIPIGRHLYTERQYREVLAWFGPETSAENPFIGPLWVKTMGVEKTGSSQATVTFCTDHGHWRRAKHSARVRIDRATIESYVMEYVQTGDGERRWLADQHIDLESDPEVKYGAECDKWAQHQP